MFVWKKNKDSIKENKEKEIEEEKFYFNSEEEIVVNIKREVNQVYQYKQNEETSKIYLLDKEISRRGLNEELIKSKINYGLNIYNEEELSDKYILYSALALILQKE